VRITVLGATGGIGRATTTELVARGHDVTASSRSITAADAPAGARPCPADLTDTASTAAVVRGADVVVMAAQVPYPRWHRELLPLFDGVLTATAAAGARLVAVDNLYAYGVPEGPIADVTPEATTTRKGALRRELGRRLLAAHHEGRARVTIARFSDYYGPGGTNSLIHQLGVARVIAGRSPQVFIDGDQPHTFAYLPDAARGVATLAERPDADGRSWILPATEAVTQRQLLTELAELAGLGPKIGRIGPAMLWAGGLFDPQLRETREMTDSFARPYVTRADDFEAAFGAVPLTPHRVALTTTLAAARDRAVAGAVAASQRR
jgi:nucleoside-diphosphate-sugar epimerase